MLGSDEDKLCNLNLKQRLILLLVLSGVSCFLSFISLIPFSRGDADIFAVIYCICTACNVGLIFVINKPSKEIKRLKESRSHLLSAILLMIAIILVLIVSFTVKNIWLTLLCICLQYACYFMFVFTASALFSFFEKFKFFRF